MGYKVESTRLAGQDLDEILNYMVKELGSRPPRWILWMKWIRAMPD